MIVPPTGIRVLVATKPVDFRKGMDGLAALVQEELKADPFSGVIYVFRAQDLFLERFTLDRQLLALYAHYVKVQEKRGELAQAAANRRCMPA